MDSLPTLVPEVSVGDKVRCPHCLNDHPLVRNVENSVLLMFECGGELRLGAIAGRLVVGGEFHPP